MLRLRTKEDVDRHVQLVLRKVVTEAERKQKCFQFAQLYMKLNEYESARRCLASYLSQRPDSAPGHKLLGQALEGLGLLGQALSSYETALKYDSRQPSLLYKVCELYLNKDVPFDPEKAQVALEKAQHAYPHDPVIFSLQEKIMGASSDTVNTEEFEKMLFAEVKARPNDVNLRVKLLMLFVNSGRVELAYSNAINIECKKQFNSELSWYQCVDFICENYKSQFPAKCNWEFYMVWLSALDRTCCHLLHARGVQDNKDATTKALFKFDKVLHQGSRVKSNAEVYADFINHMSGQLIYHMAIELIQKAKTDPSSWTDTKYGVGVLLLLATNWCSDLDSVTSLMNLNDSLKKCISSLHHHAKARLCQAGYTLISLSQEASSKKQYIDKINFFASGQWRSQIYQKLFRSIKDEEGQQSHFMLCPMYKEIPQKFPSPAELKPSYFVESMEVTYNNRLESLVWLGLRSVTTDGGKVMIKDFHSKSFSNINFSSNNLSNCNIETLNQLDIDSFLYCTILLVNNTLEEQKLNGIHSFDRPLNLPSEVSDYFIPDEVFKWWNLALNMTSSQLKRYEDGEKVTKNRFHLLQGLEELRGGQLPLSLLISLARIFSIRAESEKDENRKRGCGKRAFHLWDQAIVSIKGLSTNVMSPNYNKRSLFSTYPSPKYSTEELNRLMEEGSYFMGCHYLKVRLLERASDLFQMSNSPEALFKQATVYEMMARNVSGGLRGDEVTSELRSREAVLATKARECLRRAAENLSDPLDPLATAISEKTADIDTLLCRIEPDNGLPDGNGVNISLESLSIGSGGSPPVTPRYRLNRSKQYPASTPKHDFISRMNAPPAVDIADIINTHQSTNSLKLQQMTEQSRLILDRLDNIYFEQRTQRTLFDDLSNKVSKLESELKSGLSELKKDVKKSDHYSVVDDEEYPGAEDVMPYPTINPYYPVRGIQNAGPLYSTPMPQYFSPNQIYPGGIFGLPGAGGLGDTPQLAELLRSGPAGAAAAAGLRSMGAPIGLQQTIIPPGILSGLSAQLQPTVPPLSTTPAMHPLSTTITPTAPRPQPPPQSLGPNNVVITTSDTLPTTVPSSTPTLSVTIPPEHRLGTPAAPAAVAPTPSTPGSRAPHLFQIPMPHDVKIVEKSPIQDPSNDDIEGELDVHGEHDPLPNFKPIIPLPDEVEVRTGEENEKVLFNEWAKLYRFVEKEWKERGAGPLKILKNEDTGKYRILMRRDNVQKICANHFITDEVELIRFSNTGKAWMWWALDYSDEKVEAEKFVAKFKTSKESELFKSAMDSVKAAMKTAPSTPKLSFNPVVSAPNNNTTNKPPSTSTPLTKVPVNFGTPQSEEKPSKAPASSILSPPKLAIDNSVKTSSDTTKSGQIVVGGITFSSPPKTVPEKVQETKQAEPKPNIFASFSFGSTPAATSKFVFGAKESTTPSTLNEPASAKTVETPPTKTEENPKETAKTDPDGWKCLSCNHMNPKNAAKCVSCKSLPPLKQKAVAGEWTCSACYVTNKPGTPSCIACGNKNPSASSQSTDTSSATPAVTSKFSFGVTNWQSNTAPALSVAFSSKPSTGFIFGSQPSAATTPSTTPAAATVPATTQSSTKPVFTFGASAPALTTSSSNSFGASKFKFTAPVPATTSTPDKVETVVSKATALDDSNEVAPEDDDHMKGVHFEPVVALPDKVDVKTGEEEEEVVYSHRAKLFRYDDNPKAKEWKERGVGDIKILRHATTGKLRLLMRREPIMKLCLNHYITPDIEMKQKDSKSWFWYAADFSDGDNLKVEEAIRSFSIRFKTPDIASDFKEAFDKAQKEVVDKKLSPQKGAPKSSSLQPVGSKPAETNPSQNVPESNSSSDDDVIIVSENTVSDELKAKAEQLKLPPKFYAYLDSPPCSGCRGCENDSEEENANDVKSFPSTASLPPKTSSISTFGVSGGPLFSSQNTPAKAPGTPLSQNTPNIFAGTGTPGFGKAGSGDTTLGGTPKPINDSLYCGTPRGGGDTPMYMGSPNASFFGGTPDTSVFGATPNKSMYGTPNKSIFGGTPKTGDTAPATPSDVPKFGGNLFSGGSVFGSSSANQTPSMGFSFASVPPKPTEPENKTESKDASTTASSTPTMAAPLFATSSGNELSFASFASTAPQKSSFVKSADFKWEGTGASVFGGTATATAAAPKINEDSIANTTAEPEEEDEGGEEGAGKDDDDYDPHFEPIVPLPNKIELRTGEEDEDVVYTERCKLYRMDHENKEWKERGIGNIKLLKHKETGSYRLLMRREQVHKTVLNHFVTPELDINPIKSSTSSWCWCAMNLSQDVTEPQKELLSVRFKNQQLADAFKAAVEAAQADMGSKK